MYYDEDTDKYVCTSCDKGFDTLHECYYTHRCDWLDSYGFYDEKE